MDGAPHWDEAAGLLWMITREPHPTNVPPNTRVHVTRDSLWYAAGLFLRDQPGDRTRALRAIESTLETQFITPGTPHYGSYKRSPEEPEPPAESVVWKHFDPNWREFCGTMLAAFLQDFGEALPPDLTQRIDVSLQHAAAGALARNVPASYTNIALMSAFMLRYAGDRFDRAEWRDAGEVLAAEVYRLYQQDETFPEYNSPYLYAQSAASSGMLARTS
ncbi:MAG TPA: hypothetical protein VGW38_18005 [Chloroflexota bacterium]|nr:hypothetical protein [Chloroflexota bacterium]